MQDLKPTYDIEKWESERLKQIGLVNMRLKRNYIMISQRDIRKWEDFRNNSVSNSQFISPDKDEIHKFSEAQLKLPKKTNDFRNIRINKLQKIIEKTTSRYDEDYQINFMHKIKN